MHFKLSPDGGPDGWIGKPGQRALGGVSTAHDEMDGATI